MKYDEFHKLVRANGWVVLRGRELGKGLERKMKKDMKIIRIK